MRPGLPNRHRYSRSSERSDYDASSAVSDTQSPLQLSDRFLSARLLRRPQTNTSSNAYHDSITTATDSREKGPLGLTTVYQPLKQHTCVAHIIFVHGLGGDSEHTWSKNGIFWPRDLLPHEDIFHLTAIHSFGYDSNFKKSSILNVEDFSNALLHGILHNPLIQATKSPIILVAHSMGGLVIKKAYVVAKSSPTFSDVAGRIKAMCFIATPHTGSSLAPILDKVFRLSSGLKPYLEDIKLNSETIQSINSEFPWISMELLVYSFFETSRLKLGGIREVIVVPKEDAILRYPQEKTQLLYGDHRSICKYDSPNDHNFITMWQAIATCLKELGIVANTTAPPLLSGDEGYHTTEDLNELLGVWEPPADELLRVTTDRLEGTCRWLTEAEDYQEWQESPSSKIFWLRGPPGSGKSFVAGCVIEDLKNSRGNCCYYFFNHADRAKTTMENFLLSITWQMASLHPDIEARLLKISERDRDIGKSVDYRTFQRKFWEQGIFQVELDHEVFWVIDAFDECNAGQELAKFLVRVQEKMRGTVKVFVSTREDYHDYHLSLNHAIPRDIVLDDIQTDIANYLDAYKHEIPGSNSLEREVLKNQILEKANGCFLWAILVIQRLSKTVGAQARLRALEELQPGMDLLYSRIVQSMSQKDRDISLTILTWTVCAVRPLTTAELKWIIEDKAMDEIDDIETIASRHCHDLIFIDKNSRVRMRHTSTKKFFLRQDINSEFDQNMTIQESEAHKTLAMACLNYLNGPEMKAKTKRKMVASSSQQRSPFADYACTALSQHVNKSQALDGEITAALACFLRSNVLSWIEYLASQGDLETVLQFAQVLKVFLRRKSRVQLLLGDDVVVIDAWATDLVRVISKFGRQILMHPESILNIIPPFCPPDSLIFTRFARSPGTAVTVAGLSSKDWDECLCTAMLSDQKPTSQGRRERLHSLASSDDQFCIGTSTGRIAIFSERTCLEENIAEFGQPVILMEYAASEPLLASAGRKIIRIWNTETWETLWEYHVKYNCLAMSFVDDDKILLLVLSNNTLLAMNLNDRTVNETCWTETLEEPHRNFYHNSSPQFVSFNTGSGLLAIAYRSRRLLVYNYERDSYQIFDHRDGLSESTTQASAISIYSLEFSCLPDSSLLAVSYSSSDLVLFDTEAGTINMSLSKPHYSHLVSSPDGQTLAAATRDGTIELYDFETLHKLYRILSDGGAVSVMRFTAASTRLLVIRAGGYECRVWGPAALYRRNVDSHSTRTPSLGSGSQDGVFDEPHLIVNQITAISTDASGSFFFVSKGDCSVSVYDTKTGLSISHLFSHRDTIKRLYFAAKGTLQILFSIDAAGLLMAHRITREHQAWNAEQLYTYRGPVGVLRQFLYSQDLSNILVTYADCVAVLDASTGVEVTSIGKAMSQSGSNDLSQWVQHPNEPAWLLHVTAASVSIRLWSTLDPVPPGHEGMQLVGDSASELRIHAAMSFFTGRNAIWVTTLIYPPYGPRGPYKNLFYSASRVRPSDESVAIPLPVPRIICDAIDVVLGSYRERLVFLHTDGWICSIKSTEFHETTGGGSESIMHHFAPPADWLLASKILIRLTKLGDVLFVVRGEVAVVKRGLERTAEVRSRIFGRNSKKPMQNK